MLTHAAQTAVDFAPAVAETLDDSAFSAMREEWNELLSHSRADCLFLTWEWLHTWWKHLAEGRRLSILALRREGRLIGLAPLAKRPPALSNGHLFSVMELLGSGQVGSDYLDIVTRRGDEETAAEELAGVLALQSGMLKWTNLSADTELAGVASHLQMAGWSWEQAITNVCPYIPLEGKTWEAYLAELGAEQRYNFHRKLRRLHRDFTVAFEPAATLEQAREALEVVIDLHLQRRSTLGGSDAFHRPEFLAFHREFVALAFSRGWLRLYVLRLNGKPAACLYGFLYGDKFYYYQSGFDPAYERYSPGMIVMGLSIQAAIAEGAREYDLLHGDEAYKSHWSSRRRDLTRIELFPPGVMGRHAHAAIELIRKHRRVAHRLLRNAR